MTPACTIPKRVFNACDPWPLHDRAHSRSAEARALATERPQALMGRAGLAAARLAVAVAPHARRVVVLAGPGNNGGDGLLAAMHLHRLGRTVRVHQVGLTDHLPHDAADALRQAREAGVPVTTDAPDLADADLLVDGLLGLGASRAPVDALAAAIRAANGRGRPILAIDLPSGLDGNTGCVLGTEAVRAIWTLSLLTLKPGLFTAEGRDHAGEVWFDSLGIAVPEAPQAWLGPSAVAPAPGFATRRHNQHKGSFGDVTVVGGAPGMQGAATLAAEAALTAGAGRVYVRLLADGPGLPGPPELMISPPGWLDDASALARATVVCGCGGGVLVARALPRLLQQAGRLVLDADALNAIAGSPDLQAELQARSARGALTVITPHPLEGARLLGSTTSRVQSDRLAAATMLARRFGATVVLKGSGTVVAAPERCPWINASGNAALAAPGTGDVLAGWIGGLWAQQGGGDTEAAWFAARASVWLHGRAADRHAALMPGAAFRPMRAGDLAKRMAESMR